MISTVVPKTSSLLLERVSRSAGGGSVVTSTSKAEKSSATRFQMYWIRCSSLVPNAYGEPSRSKGRAVTVLCPVLWFQAVPVSVAPAKFR